MLLQIPNELYQYSYNLKCLSLDDVAWEYEKILQVIEHLTNNDNIILGGDVYQLNRETFEVVITGDSWYCNKNKELSLLDNVRLSKMRAIEYIKMYHTRNGTDLVYSLVCTK